MRKLPWLLWLVASPVLANERAGGSVVLTSDYRLHGISQSDGAPALQADLHYDTPAGWFTGVWASSYTLYGQESDTVELSAFVGHRWQLATDWSAKVMLSHYAHPWNLLAQHYDYDELTVATAWRDRLFLSVSWSPNNSLVWSRGFSLNRTALAYDATTRMPLRGSVSAVAGVGYYDLTDLVGTSYWYGSAGLVYDLPSLHVEVSRVQTSGVARELFYGGVADSCWAATLMWTF